MAWILVFFGLVVLLVAGDITDKLDILEVRAPK
jgi:hypothetical protein